MKLCLQTQNDCLKLGFCLLTNREENQSKADVEQG
jgi:hypothetical protein